MPARYRIATRPAPAPFAYPAKFRLGEGDDYIKYGHAALPEGRRGGDPYWTPQIITQAWYQAETGHIPISGAGYGGPFAGPGFDGLWLDMSEIVRPTRDGIHGRETIATAVDLGHRLDRLAFAPDGALASEMPPSLQLPIPVLFNPAPEPVGGPGVQRAFTLAARQLGTLALVPGEWGEASDAWLLRPDEVGVVPGRARLVEVDLTGQAGKPVPLETALEAWRRAQEAHRGAVISLRLPLAPGSAALAEALARAGVEVIHLAADDLAREWGGARTLPEALRAVHERLLAAGLRDRLSIVASGGIAAAEHVPKALACGADVVGVDFILLVALGCALWADVRHPCPVEEAEIDPAWGAQRIANLMAAWRDQLLEVLGAMGLRDVRRLRGELGRAIFHEEQERELREAIGGAGEGGPHLCGPRPRDAGSQRLSHCQEGGTCSAGRPIPGEVEGDLRWPAELLLATAEQARTGRPPASGLEHRIGRSGGGFDCLRLACEEDNLADGMCCRGRFAALRAGPSAALRAGPSAALRAGGSRTAPTLAVCETQAAAAPATTAGQPAMTPRRPLRLCGEETSGVDLSLDLNRRGDGRPVLRIPQPWYGAGMSFGSVGLNTMLARAMAAQACGGYTSTGEGGYPAELVPYARHVITQVATGLFGVSEETIRRAPIVEFKYAQGAKPGLGGHLLAGKVTAEVAAIREAVPGCSLFSPFPFHSVYSVEDHKKHVDWIAAVNPEALISVKVSTPSDVDMVAVGSYYAGAHIVHLDGAYGGTGAAPEIAKKNIAMPIEYAIGKVHRFLEAEGIRDEVVVMASGGIRTAYDIAKAIALGADGCVIGTAELVALGCLRLGTCEKGGGCPLGIATTDPRLAGQIDPAAGARRIGNLYAAWRAQLAGILRGLGLTSVRALRGRTDLLRYVEQD